jgi:hypothetical protein
MLVNDVALSTVVPIKSVSTIVTDPSADPVEVERIAREGVEVILVEPGVSAPADEGSATRESDVPLAVAT